MTDNRPDEKGVGGPSPGAIAGLSALDSPQRSLRECSVDRDHHVRGLDDGIGGLAACQFELVDSLVGN